jgi:hypothetical protein
VPNGSPTVPQLSYDEAVRSIEQQRRQLDELRTRTGTLISAASISIAFLGATAAAHTAKRFPLEFLWALIPFGLAIVLCTLILLPYKGWSFALRADAIQAFDGQPPPQVQLGLAKILETANDTNDSRIKWMSGAFAIAALLMLWSIIAWIVIIESPMM